MKENYLVLSLLEKREERYNALISLLQASIEEDRALRELVKSVLPQEAVADKYETNVNVSDFADTIFGKPKDIESCYVDNIAKQNPKIGFDFDKFMDVFELYKGLLKTDYSDETAAAASRAIYDATNGVIDVTVSRKMKMPTKPLMVSVTNTPFLREYVLSCHVRNHLIGYNKLPSYITDAFKFQHNIDIRNLVLDAVNIPTEYSFVIEVRRNKPHLSSIPELFSENYYSKGLNYLTAQKRLSGKIGYICQSKKPNGALKIKSDTLSTVLTTNGHGGVTFGKVPAHSEPTEHMLNTIIKDYSTEKQLFKTDCATIMLTKDSENENNVWYRIIGVIAQ